MARGSGFHQPPAVFLVKWLAGVTNLQQTLVVARHTVGCRVSGVGCRVSGVGCRVSGVGCRVSGVGCRVSDNTLRLAC